MDIEGGLGQWIGENPSLNLIGYGYLWSISSQGRFIFGAGLAMSLVTSLAEAEGVGPAQPGWRRLGFPPCFPARHGLDVAWTGVEDHPREPPCLDPVTALLGQDGEVAQGQMSVDALIDAAELPHPSL